MEYTYKKKSLRSNSKLQAVLKICCDLGEGVQSAPLAWIGLSEALTAETSKPPTELRNRKSGDAVRNDQALKNKYMYIYYLLLVQKVVMDTRQKLRRRSRRSRRRRFPLNEKKRQKERKKERNSSPPTMRECALPFRDFLGSEVTSFPPCIL